MSRKICVFSYLESISDQCGLFRNDSTFLCSRLALPNLFDYLS